MENRLNLLEWIGDLSSGRIKEGDGSEEVMRTVPKDHWAV